MLYKVRVGKNGRITIPIEIRRELGLQTGDVLILEMKDEKIIMRKPTTEELTRMDEERRRI